MIKIFTSKNQNQVKDKINKRTDSWESADTEKLTTTQVFTLSGYLIRSLISLFAVQGKVTNMKITCCFLLNLKERREEKIK